MFAYSLLNACASRAQAIVVLALFSAAITGCGSADSSDGAAAPAPPSVRAITVERTAISHYATYTGRTRGAREVDVRARVDGILERRVYDEGARVAADETLFEIDPRPYAIAVARAQAELANAHAATNEAEREWSRIEGLYKRDATSTRERDRARSALELARAEQAMAQAGVDEARLQQSYTKVAAPVAGVSGLETVPEGTLVERGTLLTTIVQTDPLHIRFSVPEREALIRRQTAADADDTEAARRVQLLLDDGSVYPHDGVVDFTSASVDPATGTVVARAVFPNPDNAVQPGQFRRVRLLLETFEDAIRVPEEAISEGDDGPQVFVVENGRARARAVTLGPVVDGKQVLRDGVEAGDRVVVAGLTDLADGDEVSVQDEAASTTAAADSASGDDR